MKVALRVVSIAVIVLCIILGFSFVTFYDGETNEDVGITMLRLLYEYDTITDVYAREDQIESLCSEEVYEEIGTANTHHFEGTWGRTQNVLSKVRVVLTRPGLIIYALDNDFVHPRDLWCFEYEVDKGIFTHIREYKLVSIHSDEEGGFLG